MSSSPSETPGLLSNGIAVLADQHSSDSPPVIDNTKQLSTGQTTVNSPPTKFNLLELHTDVLLKVAYATWKTITQEGKQIIVNNIRSSSVNESYIEDKNKGA